MKGKTMFRRKRACSLLLLISAALLAAGCGGRLVQRQDLLEATTRIALVSTVMPRVADTSREANRKVLQAAVDHAAAQARTGLAGIRPWKVLDAATIDHGKAVMSLGNVSHQDLSSLFPHGNEQNWVRQALAAQRELWQERFIGAAGLPIIPREAFTPGEGEPGEDPSIRRVLLDQAGKLCNALQVDAAAIVQMRCMVTHPREKAFIVTDERTDGMLALSATLIVVDKTGTIIADMGVRPINELSPSRDLLPLYRGAGREAVAAGNIDLADPKKKISQALFALIDAAVADLMASLKAELTR
jgi:hypothetical protein